MGERDSDYTRDMYTPTPRERIIIEHEAHGWRLAGLDTETRHRLDPVSDRMVEIRAKTDEEVSREYLARFGRLGYDRATLVPAGKTETLVFLQRPEGTEPMKPAATFIEAASRLEAIDAELLKSDLDAHGFKWFYVEGAVDFVTNMDRQDEIISSYQRRFKDDRSGFESSMATQAELHIRDYTPRSWKEPIRVPVGGVDPKVCNRVAKILADALYGRKK